MHELDEVLLNSGGLPKGELFAIVGYPIPRPPESELANLRPGSWATSSRIDSRFNLCGLGRVLPRGWSGEAIVAIRRVERRHQCKAPADIALSVVADAT